MRFRFMEKKAEVTDELRQYAQKKVGKLEKYFKQEADATINFRGEGNRKTLEVTVINNGVPYRAHEIGDDFFKSVDKAVSGLERQIHKNKTRLEKQLRSGAFDKAADFETEPEETEFNIIRTKKFSLKPMTPEEAILQMNLLKHKFFVFRNFSSGGAFSVVYVRDDGGYGLIEEE